jgi:hypothetical protein
MARFQDNRFFSEMENTSFSFQAVTRIWFGMSSSVPAGIANDLRAVQKFILDPANRASTELVFTGSVSILRGKSALHPDTGRLALEMSVDSMDEYCYSKDLDTTLHLTAQPNNPSVGFTHQLVDHMDAPAEGRLALNLELNAIQGRLNGVLAAAPCTTKTVMATFSWFPFSNGQTVFHHVGDTALPVGANPNAPLGYLAYGIMVPVAQLGPATPAAVATPLGTNHLAAHVQDFIHRRTP